MSNAARDAHIETARSYLSALVSHDADSARLTPDVRRINNGKLAVEGADAILAFFKESMDRPSVLSSHRVHHPEIDIDGDKATGIWALEDVFMDAEAGYVVRGAAFYEDRYVKVDGEWKIEHTGYERTYEELENRKDNPNVSLTQGWPPA